MEDKFEEFYEQYLSKIDKYLMLENQKILKYAQYLYA